MLLDAAQSYQREVQRPNADVPAEVSELLARMRDPDFARMLLVTLAESTPVQEAERLQADVRRAGIEPYGWVIKRLALGSEHRSRDAARPRRRRMCPHRPRRTARRPGVAGRLAAPAAGRSLRVARVHGRRRPDENMTRA